MTLYKTTITPTSNFATSIKGDTLFGQLCWAIKFTFGQDRLKELLSNYANAPFTVVSDAFAKGYLPKPSLPSSLLNEDASLKKQNRKKIWLTLEELQSGKLNQAKTNKEVDNEDKATSIVRNSINYLTSTTGGNGFDPYSVEEFSFTSKDIYFLIDTASFSKDELEESLQTMSKLGYGADTTVGKGRFEFSELEEITLNNSSTTYMTLSPVVLDGLELKNSFYEPFTRFGKTGYDRAVTNAFKKPLLLADSSAVVVFEQQQNLQYIGKAINNISTYKDIVHQGYAIVVAMKDLNHENL